MTLQTQNDLPWPRETAGPTTDTLANFVVPRSNIVLDFHGDPITAGAVVFSDGNHHMALEAALTAFAEYNPNVGDIFYATTPPRVIVDAMRDGGLMLGNMCLSVQPHVFISPTDVIDTLVSDGFVTQRAAYKRSRGNTLLVRKGNPKDIRGIADLLREDVRFAISNPITEKASYSVYQQTLCSLAEQAGLSGADMQAKIDDAAALSQLIHHREIPQILGDDRADVAPVYYHLGLRYTRIFPEMFELVSLSPLAGEPGATDANITSTYDIGLVGGGGDWGPQLFEFLSADERVVDIYRAHGLDAAA